MNKKLLAGLLTTATLATLLVSATQADAALSTEANSKDHMSTRSGISFYNTNGPGGGPFKNNLALAWAPLNFDFGNHEVTAATNAATYNQVLNTGVKQYVSVSDDRKDKLTQGWSLYAELDNFENVADEKDTLANAKLSFSLGNLEKYNIDIDASDKGKAATPNITDAGSLGTVNATHLPYYTELPTSVSVGVGQRSDKNIITFKASQNVTETLAVAREVSNVSLDVANHTNVVNKKYASTLHWRLGLQP